MAKIFLVEDDEYIGRVYERGFRLAGHELVRATDGAIALHDLETMDPLPAAIILDLVMPNMDGGSFLMSIKKSPRLAQIPVAVLTNSFHTDDEKKFRDLGAEEYLIKIDNKPSDVVKKVEALVNKHTSPKTGT